MTTLFMGLSPQGKVWSVDLAKNIPAMTTNGKYAKLEPFYAIVIGLILAKVDKMYPPQVSTDQKVSIGFAEPEVRLVP